MGRVGPPVMLAEPRTAIGFGQAEAQRVTTAAL
jgi:hypothetical protein